MIKRSRKAQGVYGISFGAIFSIIVIIAIIGVAFFAINHFLNLNKCSKVVFFYDDLQGEINKAWTSNIYRDTFVGELPTSGLLRTGIKQVCFGNTTQLSLGAYHPDQQRLYNEYGSIVANIFIEPPENACDGDFAYSKLEHVYISRFFCVENNGEIAVTLSIAPADSLVTLKP